MAMYAAGVGALCISSSVAAVMMNKKDDEAAVPAEQPEETVEQILLELLHKLLTIPIQI